MNSANTTEKVVPDFLPKCLHLLNLNVNVSLDDLGDISNVTSESLEYCLKNIGYYPSATQPYILPEWQQLLWSVSFAFLIVIGIVGNILVIWTVLAHRHMRTVTNMFLVNLSIADLFMAIFNTSFSFAYMLNSHWPFGRKYCTFHFFTGIESVAASVFTITAISVDRYMAIVRPLSPRISKRIAFGVIALIWTMGCALSIPNILFSDTKTFKYPDGTERTVCYLIWPDIKRITSKMDLIYNIIIMLTTYAVPISIIIFTYSWMIHTLWTSKAIGILTTPQRLAVRSKHRVARMFTVVAFLFAVCWLPYHIYFLFTYFNPKALESQKTQQIYLAIYWIAMSNSTINPLVYYWMNSTFRSYFRRVFCYFRMAFSKVGFASTVQTMNGSILHPGWSRKTTFTTISMNNASRRNVVRSAPLIVNVSSRLINGDTVQEATNV